MEHSNPNLKVIHWDVLQVDLPKDGLYHGYYDNDENNDDKSRGRV